MSNYKSNFNKKYTFGSNNGQTNTNNVDNNTPTPAAAANASSNSNSGYQGNNGNNGNQGNHGGYNNHGNHGNHGGYNNHGNHGGYNNHGNYANSGGNGGNGGRPRIRNIRSNDRSAIDEENNIKFDSNMTDLLEKDDIVCSPEVFEKECDSFDSMGGDDGLKEKLLMGVYAYGFESPSKIQGLAIPQIISGKEILAQSQAGTGKTGAFVISALQLIDETQNVPQAIILSPTNELANQTYVVARSLGNYMKEMNYSFTVGGCSRDNNIRELGGSKKNDAVSQLIVATPGRLKDLLTSFPALFDHIKLLIIDECDELLSGTFKDELRIIISGLPSTMQICLFSATVTKDVVALADLILKNPVKILIKKEKITLKNIKQTYVDIANPKDKIDVLIDMLAILPTQQFIVYVNSKRNAEWLKEQLENEDFSVMTINSSNSKADRAEIVRNFKNGQAKCLISTDLLARGIDIQQLSLVINYDLPRQDNIQAYIHRIGRSGRFGKNGLAINLVTRYDKDTLNSIQLLFKCQIVPLKEDFIKDI